MHQSVLDQPLAFALCKSVALIAAVHTGRGKTFLPNVGPSLRMAKWDTASCARRASGWALSFRLPDDPFGDVASSPCTARMA